MNRERDRWNGARFVTGNREGHYESWFQRANAPGRPLALWIRYTVFSLAERPDLAIGELWAVFFDGERERVVAVKEEHPIHACRFSRSGLDVRIGDSTLDERSLEGGASSSAHAIRWSLRHRSAEPPLLLLPPLLYSAPLPRAKALVGSPLASFEGELEVDGERIAIDRWVGSQNHNWGSRHTDAYAWGQVAGFDDAPEAFLEISTARLRLGRRMTPPMTVLVLREGEEELRLNGLRRALRARASYEPFEWRFESASRDARVRGTITAPAWSFVALPYGNPPGGIKTCLNSKLARCELEVTRGRRTHTYTTAHRAAFEILTDDPAPAGVHALVR